METISAPEEIRDSLSEYLQAKAIALDLVEGEASLNVVTGQKGQPCDARTIRVGGWIACGTALGMASRLGIPTRRMGALLDHLQVKIRACSLGCFD